MADKAVVDSLFKELDTDGDGHISKEEFAQALLAMNGAMAKAPAPKPEKPEKPVSTSRWNAIVRHATTRSRWERTTWRNVIILAVTVIVALGTTQIVVAERTKLHLQRQEAR